MSHLPRLRQVQSEAEQLAQARKVKADLDANPHPTGSTLAEFIAEHPGIASESIPTPDLVDASSEIDTKCQSCGGNGHSGGSVINYSKTCPACRGTGTAKATSEEAANMPSVQGNDTTTGRCCDNGYFGDDHICQKQPNTTGLDTLPESRESGPGTGTDNPRPDTFEREFEQRLLLLNNDDLEAELLAAHRAELYESYNAQS